MIKTKSEHIKLKFAEKFYKICYILFKKKI